MNDQLRFPPWRDLPRGRLEARKQHLLSEIAHEPKPSLRLPTIKRVERWRSWRGALVVAVTMAVLGGAGVAIAAGFGGFSGFSATQHPRTGADQLDAQTLASIRAACSGGLAAPDSVFYNPYCHLVLDSARFLTDTGPRGKVWIIADTRGDLCAVGGFGGCTPPLSTSQPITFGASQPGPVPGAGGTFTAAGLAMDGVVSVSFVPVPGDGTTVTVPVKNNIWIYQKPDTQESDAHCIVAHMADGTTVNPFPEVPCP
jgi:hypothetical protein